MKEVSLFRQPGKLITTVLITIVYVAMVYIATDYFSRFCDTVITLSSVPEKILKMFAIYLVMQSILLIVKYFYDVTCIHIREKILASVRLSLLELVLTKLKIERYEHIGNERISSVLINDIKTLGKQAIMPQMELVKVVIRLLAFIVLLFTYNAYIGSLTIVISTFIFLSSLPADKIVKKPSRALALAKEQYLQEYQELLDCRPDFKYAGQDHYLMKKMNNCNERIEQASCNLRNAKTIVLFIHFIVRNIAWCIILAAELSLVSKGSFSVGQILATISVFSLIEDDISALQLSFESLSEASSITARIEKLTNAIVDCIVSPYEMTSDWSFFGIKSFCFGYDFDLISNAEVTFRRGQKYAIIGPSGSGKSSFIKILLGINTNYSGILHMDGIELSPGNNAISERTAYLGQDFYLFNDTIDTNLYFGDASRKKRLESASFYEVVKHYLPDLNNCIIDNGTNLSGGQRQIIGIARAIAQGKDILVLDESLSATDAQLFEMILSVLTSEKDLTFIFISHRVHQCHGFDHILELKEGALCEII